MNYSRFALGLVALSLTSSLLGQRPSGWRVRYDQANAVDSTLFFETMAPGWHITTGPAAILYDTAQHADQTYRFEAEIFLFPGGGLEGFGVFVGGHSLADEDQTYTYFLIRKDGKFLVKQREGQTATVLVPWSDHASIVKHLGGNGTAMNVVAVVVGSDSVRFVANREVVAKLPRSVAQPDGIAGLRVNHALNLHVSKLALVATGMSAIFGRHL
ncbi:MAG: hypothetical protein ABR543_12245 [Gemmatimonadaceae bacterium]